MSERVCKFREKLKADSQRYQQHLEKERDRDHRRRENLNLKRLLSKDFDEKRRNMKKKENRCTE